MIALSRIELLLQQQKYDLAKKEITLYLANNPNEGIAHTFHALALLGTGENNKALEAAKVGVGLSPMSSFGFYVLSRCYLGLDDLKKAEEAQQRGLSISPDEEHYLTNYAAILNDLGKKEEALVVIDKALKINPLSSGAKQVKSIILRRLGRYKEADVIAGESLKDNPESANAFAAKGWASLDTGKPKEALGYFRSAVMLEPTNDYAKSGMVMAMKAQNGLFNLFYKYYNWIGRLPSRARWGLAIGIVVLLRIFDSVKTYNEHLVPFFGVVVGAYLCFVFLAWTINPVFNIFLLFNKYGKHALNKGEKLGAWVMLSLLGAVAVQLGVHVVFPVYPLIGGIGFLFLALPAASTFANWGNKSFKKHFAYTVLLTASLLGAVLFSVFQVQGITEVLWIIFLIGVVAYSWISQMFK